MFIVSCWMFSFPNVLFYFFAMSMYIIIMLMRSPESGPRGEAVLRTSELASSRARQGSRKARSKKELAPNFAHVPCMRAFAAFADNYWLKALAAIAH
jgi:hypothetical protein